MMKLRELLQAAFALFWISLPLVEISAAEINVSPGEKSLSRAVKNASPGDVLILSPGVYHDPVAIKKSLTLRGTEGVILNGSKAFTKKWSEVPGMPGVYRVPLKKRMRGLLLDGKFIAEIRYDRTKKSGEWNWKTLLTKGMQRSGFDQINSFWMYHPETQQVYARFPEGRTPEGLKLRFLPDKPALIYIDGASDVHLEKLRLEQAYFGVYINNAARNCVVRECRITSFERTGIVVKNGVSDCLIADCEVNRGSLEEWTPSIKHDKANYEIWQLHKLAGNYDRVGISLFRAGSGNRVIGNHLHHVFDGVTIGDFKVESLDAPLTDADAGRDTEIANNTIENTRDSGIELGVGCINVNVHHNTFKRTHGGIRFKVPRVGPVFIHHNHLIDGSPFNIWFSMDASPALGYVYHNTVVGGREYLMAKGYAVKRDFVAPKWHFINNLSTGNSGFPRQKGKEKWDFVSSHNIALEEIPPGRVDAAIDGGLDLSTYLNGKPLPGCEPGYFKGKAPDIGADETK